MRTKRTLGLAVLLLAAPLAQMPATAQDAETATEVPALSAEMHEAVVRRPVTVTLFDGKTRSGEMIVTEFRPDGEGPFPTVIINHGRSPGDRAVPGRQRYAGVASYWLRRGFAVFVPTRLGYGDTGIIPDTEYSGPHCQARDFMPAARAAADQIAAAAAFAAAQPWVRKDQIVLMGQSVGGMATVVANSRSLPGVLGSVNVAGGSGGDPKDHPGKPCSPDKIKALFAGAGAAAKTPMLWIYALNDKYWGPEIPHDWYAAYAAAGGKAEFVELPPTGDDGHLLLGSFSSWRPLIDRFIARLGFAIPHTVDAPPATNFAALDDASKIPFVKDSVRTDGYVKFLALDLPRAFVVAPNGAWAYKSGPDALKQALDRCAKSGKPCKPYAVDDAVVWSK